MESTERLRVELHEIMRHSRALLEVTGEQLDEQVVKARKKLEDALAAAKGTYDQYGKQAMDSCKDLVDKADKLVREKPYHVIGGTVLTSLLLGWIFLKK